MPPASDGRPSQSDGELLDAVTNHLVEGLVVVVADQRVVRATATARGLLHLPDDVEGRLLSDAVDDFRVTAMVTAALSSNQVVDRELDDADGRLLVARALPVERAGIGRAVVLVVRDESRLRHLETVRRDFVANVGHELRTPVAAIQLLVETLQEGALDDRDAAAEFVARIGLETAHLAQLVSELLELATIESGRVEHRAGVVPVAALAAAAERLAPLATERGVTLQYEVEPGTPPVLGDEERLGQVVRNLVHNAIKFTPRGGTVTLRAQADADHVVIEVVDSGCGITPDQVARIFERFFKADRSRQRDGEGSGLGLAIVRHTVEAHHGTVSVVSEPGAGSTFSVRLPAVATR